MTASSCIFCDACCTVDLGGAPGWPSSTRRVYSGALHNTWSNPSSPQLMAANVRKGWSPSKHLSTTATVGEVACCLAARPSSVLICRRPLVMSIVSVKSGAGRTDRPPGPAPGVALWPHRLQPIGAWRHPGKAGQQPPPPWTPSPGSASRVPTSHLPVQQPGGHSMHRLQEPWLPPTGIAAPQGSCKHHIHLLMSSLQRFSITNPMLENCSLFNNKKLTAHLPAFWITHSDRLPSNYQFTSIAEYIELIKK